MRAPHYYLFIVREQKASFFFFKRTKVKKYQNRGSKVHLNLLNFIYSIKLYIIEKIIELKTKVLMALHNQDLYDNVLKF
jgi:hypothetical protein